MERLSIDEGLPHTDVSSIIQDNEGYIWIGTYSGLCRYDGTNITVYDMSNSILESSRIRSLYLATDGLLYIGTETGGLTIFDTVLDNFVKTIRVPSNYVNSVVPSIDDKSVIICTDNGISTLSCHDGIYDLSSCSLGSLVSSCHQLNQDEILIGTPSSIAIYRPTEGNLTPIGNIFATSMLPIEGNLLITSYEGCWIFNLSSKTLKQLNTYAAKSACIGNDGNIYIGTISSGILCYDMSFNRVGQFMTESRHTPEVSYIYNDKSDVVWVGTIGYGCYRSNANSRRFRLFSVTPGYEGDQVVAMMADRDGHLWCSSRGGRVSILKDNEMVCVDSSSLSQFSGKTISALWQSPDGSIWIGSWDKGAGIIPSKCVGDAIAGKKFEMNTVRNLPKPMSVYKFSADRFGRIWIVTGDGLFRSSPNDPQKSDWSCLKCDPSNAASLSDDCTTDILIEDTTVWVGSRSGLNKITLGTDGEIRDIQRLKVQKKRGGGEFISFIHRDHKGSLWVSVLGLGLCRMKDNGEFEIFNKTTNPEFPNNEFESMLEDTGGNFWIGGFGLVRFSPSTGKTSCFSRKDGLQSNSFKMYDAVLLDDSQMAFGGTNGFNIFTPSEIIDNPIKPQVQITSLQINGLPSTEYIDIAVPIRRCKKVRLSHNENNLNFRFSAMHYVYPEHNKYRYMMKGLDEDWHWTDGLTPSASYLSLRPGNYTFLVYAANSDGLWSNIPASIDIRILPPWYSSVLARLFYIILVFGIAFRTVVYLRRRNIRRHRKEINEKLLEEQRIRNENELKFHTEFLHEIRTPLTLITTPVEELLNNPNLGKTTINRLQLVDQSVKILRKLIESITDLRKFDNGSMHLHVVEIDFSRLVEEICLLFQPVAKIRGYDFKIEMSPLTQKVFIDKDNIEKVILNLMSNAFKYSPEKGGLIRVKISETTDKDGRNGVEFKVSNIGIGILPEDLPYIFDRFRQGKNNSRGGMGIGLSISRSAVLSHSGQIWAESVPGGLTSFFVFLPYGCSQFSSSDIDKNYENSDHISNYDPVAEFKTYNSTGTGGPEREHLVLIVDDNSELREYLVQLLSTRYNTITAEDGSKGYEDTISEQPDIVLSDIVMPKMNGLELCQKIKENKVTSHIPVILISARDLPVYKMEGYQMMADDYITKPFHAELLISRIENLIRQRKCIRQSFRTDIKLEPSAITATPVDEKFIRNCIDNIEEHISDPDYGVDDLCQSIGYSRPQLYRKIKSITGMSAIQFLRSIRLKRAAQLLCSDSGLTITEVMYAVGFNNISYFSKIFAAEFGIHPKKYKSSFFENC